MKLVRLGCPSGAALARGRARAESEIADHVRGCPRCAQEWEAMDRLSALAKELSWPVPTADRVARVRFGREEGRGHNDHDVDHDDHRPDNNDDDRTDDHDTRATALGLARTAR